MYCVCKVLIVQCQSSNCFVSSFTVSNQVSIKRCRVSIVKSSVKPSVKSSQVSYQVLSVTNVCVKCEELTPECAEVVLQGVHTLPQPPQVRLHTVQRGLHPLHRPRHHQHQHRREQHQPGGRWFLLNLYYCNEASGLYVHYFSFRERYLI